uniref:Uncharacterized protein n=1 Tax=Ditylum brightwellii TaxID=49249 RepID=A0A7S4W5F5_9STRA
MSQQEKERCIGVGRKGWELLDTCQLLPISMLDQYAPFTNNMHSNNSSNQQFKANVTGHGQRSPDCWLPQSEKYGILYEMEYIESQTGIYPATEGLLYLISALITTCGCPPDLRSCWRPRPGCSPYIEYAVDFVLPRAMGTKGGGKGLYFASQADKSRLVCRGLEVVEAVIVRYIVPISLQTKPSEHISNKDFRIGSSWKGDVSIVDETIASYESTAKSSAIACGLGPIVSKIFYPLDTSDAASVDESIRDFCEEVHTSSYSSDRAQHQETNIVQHANNSSTLSQNLNNQLPRAKSPGFSVTTNILSSTGGSLFHILAKILLENDDAKGIEYMYGQAVHSKMLAIALFNDLPPEYSGAKRGRDYLLQVQQQQHSSKLDSIEILPSLHKSMIQPLFPPSLHTVFDKNDTTRTLSGDAILWRERSVLVSLRILCAAAGREETLGRAVKSSPISLNIVPVIRFKAPVRGSLFHRGLEVQSVQISRLSQLLIAASGASAFREYRTEIIPVIAQYIAYNGTSLHDSQEIAKAAMSLILYLSQTVPHRDCLPALCGHRSNGSRYLADAISKRMCFTSSSPSITTERDVRDVILDLLLSNVGSADDQNLSHALLGLSGSDGATRSKNCLDAVLDLLSNTDFVLNPQTSSYAAKCYELIYRVCSIANSVNQSSSRVWSAKLDFMSKLRNSDFWRKHLLRFFAPSQLSSVSLFHGIVSTANLYDQHQGNQISPLLSRNIDVLHSIAWLLRGIAVELHSLMGLSASHSPCYVRTNIQPTTVAPQPRQCQKILHILFSNPHEVMLNALIDLPLHQSDTITQFLDVTAPARELVQESCATLTGAREVAKGYEVVDVDKLLSNVRNASGDEKVALQWASAWNAYVTYSCASSHLSTAWSMVLGTALVVCRPLLFGDEHILDSSTTLSESRILYKDDLITFLCEVLSRMGSSDYHSRRTSLSFSETIHSNDDGEIEAGSALQLSISALRLVELITEPLVSESPNVDADASLSIGGEDTMKICTYIIGAISSCSGRDGKKGRFRSDDRAAVLSCALTAILSYRSLRSQTDRSKAVHDSSFQRFVLNESDLYLSAASYLAELTAMNSASSNSEVTPTKNQAACAEKINTVALAARSALSSLLALFDSYEKEYTEPPHNLGDSFVAQVFGNDHGKIPLKTSCLPRLVRLITSFDTDIAYLLQQIACCRHGTELLLNAGVLAALNTAANKYLKEEMQLTVTDLEPRFDAVGRETYGAVQIEPPAFLIGHLSLLNVMLATSCPPLPLPKRQSMALDAAKFLQSHANTVERLLKSYPRNGDLTAKFVTCLHLTSSALGRLEKCNADGIFVGFTSEIATRNMDLSSALGGKVLARLEHRVLDLACHLSEYPFPSQLVPPFPTRLRDVERSRMAKMRHLSVNTSEGRCWWDLIPCDEGPSNSAQNGVIAFSTREQFSLPDPPTGSADAGRWRRKNTGRGDYRSGWSEEKYALAISSAEVNESCLAFLKSRAMVALSNSAPLDFYLNGVAIAKGLCRCSDAARAIQDRINFMYGTTGEREMNMMMDDNAVMDTGNQNTPSTFQVNRIERASLKSLGVLLGRCAESLLILASLQLRLFVRGFVSSEKRVVGDIAKERIDEFALALLPALEHTEIETMGVGCKAMATGDNEKADLSKNIAQNLREELERLCQPIH